MQTMFDEVSRARIARNFDLHPEVLTMADIEAGHPVITATQVVFGTWGFPRLNATQIQLLPNLEMVFYAAGSIKHFGRPFLEAGIPICSAKVANARVVADTCHALIVLSAKQLFNQCRAYTSPEIRPTLEAEANGIPGLNGSKIALIGCGVIARNLIARLRPLRLQIQVLDPYLNPADADALGVTICSLEDAFSSCDVISNHLPNLPDLAGLITARHFKTMKPRATFINTGRGAQINESDLITVFSERADLTAILDVTDPEPPATDSPLYSLPNVMLTPHIAGCIGREFSFLLEEVIESSEQWLRGETPDNIESLEQLDISA
ncbi:MAG: hydroxyacid dehydrogenase [Opitutaceae bacterium]|jgi:phosphoglycerate dehydrogenase-like enzyme|nr:hydroxyacid dehydrogenase [Opitutaceae bacterium]